MRRMSILPIALLAIMILVVGCATTGTGTSASSKGSPPVPEPTLIPTDVGSPTPGAGASPVAQLTRPIPAGSAPEPAIPPGAASAVELARQQLTSQTGVSSDQIRVVSVTSVQWPTSALGCPQPGRFYAQVVTPGYQIILEAAGRTYEYHSDSGRRVVLCNTP